MRVIEQIADLRKALGTEREAQRAVGFVPTMGALHEGHASLVARARQECDLVAVSIFVNPLQFAEGEDFAGYPRDLEQDIALLEREAADVLFHPSVEEMYPAGHPAIRVTTGRLGALLCGRSRPGHFDGVATVVAKMLNIVGPCRAYFGQKDAQQLVIIRRVVEALAIPAEVVGCPTVRDPDGLALSSRNGYLSAEERSAAPVLKRALDEAARVVAGGERSAERAAAVVAARVAAEPLARLDYAACVDPGTLEDLDRITAPALLAVAAWLGRARLIDNVVATPAGDRGTEEVDIR